MAEDEAWLPTAWQVLASVGVALLVCSYIPRWKRSIKYGNLPPGPFSWPLLGWTPFLDMSKNSQALRDASRKYGGIICFYVGTRFVVVLNDFDAVKSALSRDDFQRKQELMNRVSHRPEQRTLLGANGEEWRDLRKFFTSSLRTLGTGTEWFHSLILAQISDVVKEVEGNLGEDVRLDRLVELALNNVSFQLTYGKTLDHGHRLIRLLGDCDKETFLNLVINSFRIFYPWFGVLISAVIGFRSSNKSLEEQDVLIRQEILEHQERLDPEDPRDFIDLFLLQMLKTQRHDYYNMSTLIGNAKLLLVGSSDTTRNTLIWFFLLMAEHPQVQQMVQDQQDSVLGRDRAPHYTDKTDLPLLESAILESMRFKAVVPVVPPRETAVDTTLLGYDIPKETIVLINIDTVLNSPKLWKNPDCFDLNNFLSEDRKAVNVPDHFIPFSIGKRSCPGERLASSTLFVFCATILQQFQVLPPEGGVDLRSKVVVTRGHVHPFVRFQRRN